MRAGERDTLERTIVAREFHISMATVKAHMQPVLRAMGAMNPIDAIVALHRLGYSLQD